MRTKIAAYLDSNLKLKKETIMLPLLTRNTESTMTGILFLIFFSMNLLKHSVSSSKHPKYYKDCQLSFVSFKETFRYKTKISFTSKNFLELTTEFGEIDNLTISSVLIQWQSMYRFCFIRPITTKNKIQIDKIKSLSVQGWPLGIFKIKNRDYNYPSNFQCCLTVLTKTKPLSFFLPSMIVFRAMTKPSLLTSCQISKTSILKNYWSTSFIAHWRKNANQLNMDKS